MASAKEYLLAQAAGDVQNGCTKAVAAARWNVNHTTLTRRMAGQKDRHEAQQSRQRLTAFKKEFLCDWIINEEDTGRAPSKREVVEFAHCILAARDDTLKLGRHWIDAFLKRHNNIKVKLSRPIESLRAKEATPQRIQNFYDCLGHQIKTKKIKYGNIVNIDETGV